MATLEGHRYYNRNLAESTIFRQMSNIKDPLSSSAVVSIKETTEKNEEGIYLLPETHSNKLVILGMSLDALSRSGQFCVCCGGVFVFYLIYGYVQVCSHKEIPVMIYQKDYL